MLDYRALDTPTLVADDFFNAACVLGTPIEDWRALDFDGAAWSLTINGAEVGSGSGGDILGHPLEALAWLANALASRGQSLKAGEFVLLGSVVETRWVEQGDLVARVDRGPRPCVRPIPLTSVRAGFGSRHDALGGLADAAADTTSPASVTPCRR